MVGVNEVFEYVDEVRSQLASGHAREHAYRPALQRLMREFNDVEAINDPARSEHGAPDFIFQRKSNRDIILGYGEAKDIIGIDLDKEEKSEQMLRYAGYQNLYLTDYLEFRFYLDGEKYKTIRIGDVHNGLLVPSPDEYQRLVNELAAFLELPPQRITNGKRLAAIMGAKTRRIRDDILTYFQEGPSANDDLVKIYKIMKTMLVSDLDEFKFADMYSQTLVYGLFVARYNDPTPDTFDRSEARDLVPHANPFLRMFFDHIVGANFDVRLARAVDELCEVFRLSNVKRIVSRHVSTGSVHAKDPVIYFYEDFLDAYDSKLRDDMGAYYTPVPIVRFIVRNIDKVLREDFGLARGLADSSKITIKVDDGQRRTYKDPITRTRKTTKGQEIELHKVQILDPAVGTGTFLSETLNFIHSQFVANRQEGRWPSYAKSELLPRLHGFELMMAPYTIAHLKLGMTLEEHGVENLAGSRVGVYLASALEPGIPEPPDLLSMIGLAEAISDESRLASNIKNDRPLLVLLGNPPYKGESHNNTAYAKSLVEEYTFEPGTRKKLAEDNYKWLNDDYVKFLALAERQIKKTGEGVLAMITGNGYLHNPTFRGMRHNLLKTFDKLYLLDLHGSVQKRERTPEGKPDANVFDIRLGVSIIVAVKTSDRDDLAEVYFGDLYGTRAHKFAALSGGDELWSKIEIDPKFYRFSESAPQDIRDEYYGHVPIKEIFPLGSLGVVTKRDSLSIGFTEDELVNQLDSFFDDTVTTKEVCDRFGLKVADKDRWNAEELRASYTASKAAKNVRDIRYRPFDTRKIAYDPNMVARLNTKVMGLLSPSSYGLVVGRQGQAVKDVMWNLAFIVDDVSDQNIFGRGGGTVLPLNVNNGDVTVPNAGSDAVRRLTKDLHREDISHADVFDYVYGVLHSPAYRIKYKDFLKTDFPQIPPPANDEEFDFLVAQGGRLRERHLMRTPATYITSFPVAGDDRVSFYDYRHGSVWINDRQYFGDVPEDAWTHYIGGYQPAQKWLKDRKGRTLTSDDIDQYQDMIRILAETVEIMEEINRFPTWWA